METSSSRKKNNNKNNANRITLTLVVIVVMFIVLFVPAEVLNFFANMATRETTNLFNLTVTIFNLLQAINFALNFILYCAINTHFRMAFYNLATCANFRSGNPTLGKASALSTTNRGQFSTIDHHAKILVRETNITNIIR